MAVQGLGAVVAAANTDARRVQQGRDVVGMDTLHVEGRQRRPIRLLLGCWPEHGQAVNGLQPCKEMGGELLLPGVDAIKAQGLR